MSSLHEGLSSLSLSSEKNITVIFDFGFAYTKVGFAGEGSPRAIVKSEVKSRHSGKIVPVFEFENEQQLTEQLVDFIYPLYFRKLLANSKERRVVIVENILGSSVRKNTLAKVFFKYYEVVSICFIPSHLAAIMPLAVNTALVLDVGYEEATALPVYEGVPILDAWQAVPTAGQAIHRSLCELLLDRGLCTDDSGEEKRISSVMKDIPEDILEDIKVRACFVSTLGRSEKLQMNKLDRSNEPPPPPPSVVYPLSGNCLLTIPGTVRELASEVIFEIDQDFLSLASVILHSLNMCPVDTRQSLANNILVIGGTAAMKGLKSRLLAELRHLSTRPPFCDRSKITNFKVHVAPVKDNYMAWLGGAVFGCTEAVIPRSISRETYLEKGRVPDWSDQAYNPKEETIQSGRAIV